MGSRTYTTMRDLIDQEIVPALYGFDVDALVRELDARGLITWDGRGFVLETDDMGETPGLRDLVREMDIRARLEHLRGEIEAERMSYGEIAELQGLAEHIDPSEDPLLAQWAGIEEQ